jgi:hypothetical protein
LGPTLDREEDFVLDSLDNFNRHKEPAIPVLYRNAVDPINRLIFDFINAVPDGVLLIQAFIHLHLVDYAYVSQVRRGTTTSFL